MVADATTGQVLAAKDPHGHLPPASTLKILTTDTLMPVLNPGQSVVTSHQAAVVEPSKVGLIQGRRYPVHDLFKALLLISANDAAIALAQATGSYGKGVAMMNAEAHHLQAYDTVARTPNGLPAKGQHTSAYDLALFARQALTMPEFRKIEGMRVATFPLHAKHSVKLWNQNLMLGSYPGDIGGKIGWTTASEATFIGWARRGGHTLIVTIMHCVPLTEMTYAAKLLNWGFAMDGHVRPVGALVRPLRRSKHPGHAPGHRTGDGRAAPRGQAGQGVRLPGRPGRGRGRAAGRGLIAAGIGADHQSQAPAAGRKPTRSMTEVIVAVATGRARAAPYASSRSSPASSASIFSVRSRIGASAPTTTSARSFLNCAVTRRPRTGLPARRWSRRTARQ